MAQHRARQRRIAAIAAAALIPIALTACASGSGNGGKTTLTIEDYYDSSHDALYQSCGTKVGVEVKPNHVPYSGLMPKVLQQSSSRTLPDVLMLDLPDVPQIADSGALAPLADYGITGKGMTDGIVRAGTYKGKLYGLAPAVNTLTLFYNKDMFAEAGIATPPTTWEQLQADATKLSGDGRYGFAMTNTNTAEGAWQFLPFMWSNGGSEKNIDTPETVQALKFILGLQNRGAMSKSSVNWTQTDTDDQFVGGKAAMEINGPFQIPTLNKTKGLKWGAVPVPTRTAAQTSIAPLGGEAFTVPRTGDKDRMAKAAKFISCLNSPSKQLQVAEMSQTVPSDIATAKNMARKHPTLAPFVTAVQTARSRTGLLGAKWPDAATKIYTAVQLTLTGKAAPETAARQAQSENQ